MHNYQAYPNKNNQINLIKKFQMKEGKCEKTCVSIQNFNGNIDASGHCYFPYDF